ncbi:MAG TPA: L,D-transpeptidase family protein [Candidatus Competibacteraceae bacterium]|nr:L,D-transpeptidase family protein [Candidatus Competibacteraceae bacterium]
MLSTAKYVLGLWVLFWVLAAQAEPVPMSDLGALLRQQLEVDPATQQPLQSIKNSLHFPELLRQFYAQRDYQPAWLNATGSLPVAAELLEAINNAQQEGLRPADYHAAELEKRLNQAHQPGTAPKADQWLELEVLLSDAWLTYGSHLLAGRLNPTQLDPYWGVPARSRDLVKTLQEALDSGRIDESLQALSPPNPAYARLRATLAQYRTLEQQGGWPQLEAGPKLQPGMRDPRVPILRVRLQASGDLSPAAGETSADMERNNAGKGKDENRYDDALAQAVRRFQKRHGLPADGAVGTTTLAALNVPVSARIRQLELNMERWRWLPEDLGQRYILVNITDFTLNVVENGQRVMNAKVIVGRTERPTPVLTATMSYLVMSPDWNVPPTIALEDKLPILRKNAYALAKQNIRVFSTTGREIDPGQVNWEKVNTSNFAYQFRQDPGPRNALGRIKFMFPNAYSVYLHDTPSRGLFNSSARMFSSGCVRISNPIELAEYLLKDNPRWTRTAIESASQGKKQRTVPLKEQMPVHLFYWTAWVDEDGTVNFRNDIYERDKRLVKALYPGAVTKQKV